MKANLLLISTTVLWGLNYHWSKFLVNETSPFEAALWRYALAVLTLFLLNLSHLPKKKEILSNLKGIFFVGFFGLFCFNFFFFQGMQETTPLNAVLIIGLNPALTLILSAILMKTMISWKQILGILIALVGILYLLFKGEMEAFLSFQFSKGDMLIMLSSIFFALHHVWVKKYSDKMDNSNFTFLSALMCLIPLIFLNFSVTTFGDISTYTFKFWIAAIGIGCVGTGLAYWFWYKAIELTNAPRAAIYINIAPLSGAIFSIVLGDPVHIYHWISAFLIISGILVMQVKFTKRNVFS